MAPKKKSKSTTASYSIVALAKRVRSLEFEFSSIRADMSNLTEDMASLKTVVKRVDERQQRGELLMIDIQVDQQRMARTLDRIAAAMNLPAEQKPNG